MFSKFKVVSEAMLTMLAIVGRRILVNYTTTKNNYTGINFDYQSGIVQ